MRPRGRPAAAHTPAAVGLRLSARAYPAGPPIRGSGWTIGVEAETRPRDVQALKRRLALTQRDGGVDGLLLVLLDSRHNRALLRADADALAEQFPVPGRRALELLGAGIVPGGNAIVLL